MLFFIEKRLVLMLSVYIDQNSCYLLQEFARSTFSVQSAATLSGHDSSLQQNSTLFIRKDFQLFQLLYHGGIIYLKTQLHIRIFRPLTDQTAVCLRAECQIDRIDQDRLTRSRFTGQNIESLSKCHFGLINECNIFYL